MTTFSKVSSAAEPPADSSLPVHGFVVALGRHDFRGQVIGSSTKGPCDVRNLLRETKIGDLQVSVPIQKQILGLEVSVDDLLRVEVLQGKGHLSGVELSDRIGKPLKLISTDSGKDSETTEHCATTYLGLAQQTEKFTTLYKVHDHIQVARILPGTPESDQEWMPNPVQHTTLVVGVLDLLHLDHLRLLQHLDGIEAMVVLGLH